MIRELDQAGREELGPYDVCVVGSGPAGVTVVAELAGSGLALALLESGRLAPTSRGDELRKVESEGIAIKDSSRERVLGGASTTWAGLASPLDEVDLEPRPFLRAPAWPIARAELMQLYAEASARYRFPAPALFAPGGFDALRAKGDLAPQWQHLEEKVFLAAAEPQDFGREQRSVLDGPAVETWLDATVLRLEHESGTARVRCALVRSSSGRGVRVRARTFVLATGGIENARLLLASHDMCAAGLGNEHDQVGRWLMNHPKSYRGVVHFARPMRDLPYYFGCLHKGYAGYAGLRLSVAEQRRRGLLDSYVRLEPLFPWTDSRGVEALVLAVKRSRKLFSAWKRKREDEVVPLRDWSETGDDSALESERGRKLSYLALAGLVAADLPRVARYAWHRVRGRSEPLVPRARVRNFMEMEPDPGNRVTLSEARDAHGVRVPHVRHRCTDLDRRSLVALHEELARELERTGLGWLESDLATADPWPVDQDASHHMGTTRMGTDPATSVVDPDLRLHTVENVWLAGASVFPTSGCANPTLTIVALSIRLARHLRRELSAEGRA